MRRKPRFYVSGFTGSYRVMERLNPTSETGFLVVMETDIFARARVVARALNENFPWDGAA